MNWLILLARGTPYLFLTFVLGRSIITDSCEANQFARSGFSMIYDSWKTRFRSVVSGFNIEGCDTNLFWRSVVSGFMPTEELSMCIIEELATVERPPYRNDYWFWYGVYVPYVSTKLWSRSFYLSISWCSYSFNLICISSSFILLISSLRSFSFSCFIFSFCFLIW